MDVSKCISARALEAPLEPFRLALALPKDVIRLSVGEPDFDTPDFVREAAEKAIEDGFNLSYETVRCSHTECQKNSVPGLDYCVCTRRRGIYSALTGALRDLRLRVFKPLLKSELPESEKTLRAGSRTLKLFLVSCFGVTVRIHGLASPLLPRLSQPTVAMSSNPRGI